MRIGNLDGRLVLVDDEGALDVETASGGRFSPDPAAVFEAWADFAAWAPSASGARTTIDEARLGPPSPRPRQVFGIGLNYRDHAAEAGFEDPSHPFVFTKFASCLTGPVAEVAIDPEAMRVDWEVELVFVVGAQAERVPEARGWDHVAGLTIGQDISDRRLQFRKPEPAQFSLGKSRPGFGPTGPYLVTPDELRDPMDLAIECSLAGERVQASRTGEMFFSVPRIVAELSGILTLFPGDVVFTGTPGGVGSMRDPRRFISPGQQLVSVIEGLGTMTTSFVASTL